MASTNPYQMSQPDGAPGQCPVLCILKRFNSYILSAHFFSRRHTDYITAEDRANVCV